MTADASNTADALSGAELDAAAPHDSTGLRDGPGPDRDGVGTSDSGEPKEANRCTPMLEGIEVDDRELAGYPSYAVAGCTLAYVARASDSGVAGELRLRDFATAEERVIAPASEQPRRPSTAGGLVAYEAEADGRRVVRVWRAGATTTLTGAFDHAGEPRACGDAVVFTAWLAADPLGDTDVLLYEPATGEIHAVFAGPGQQRFADVGERHVAASDFSEDPDGRFDDNHEDLADIVIYDRQTRALNRHAAPGKQAFPMISGGSAVAYLHWDWAAVHPEPKLAAYTLRLGTLIGATLTSDRALAQVITTSSPYVRPAARSGIVEWIDAPPGQTAHRLWQVRVDAPLDPRIVLTRSGLLYAPAAGDLFSVVAGRASLGGLLALTAVLR